MPPQVILMQEVCGWPFGKHCFVNHVTRCVKILLSNKIHRYSEKILLYQIYQLKGYLWKELCKVPCLPLVILIWLIVIDCILKQAGCDHVLNSKAKRDRCGVCGGDNSSCRMMAGVFNSAHYGKLCAGFEFSLLFDIIEYIMKVW